jgi:hypothetical protein
LDHRRLIQTHDDLGVRAADEVAAAYRILCRRFQNPLEVNSMTSPSAPLVNFAV